MKTYEHTSKPTLNTNQLTSGMANCLSDVNGGYFITVNTTVKNQITFEGQLRRLSHKLNDFCLGRSYQRREKGLKIVAGLENGKQQGNLHAHLTVTFPDADIRRSFQEINLFVRKHWYAIIEQNNIFGTMVDVRELGDLNSRISYSMKDTDFLMRTKDFINVIAL